MKSRPPRPPADSAASTRVATEAVRRPQRRRAAGASAAGTATASGALASYLALAYAALIVYASLHPFRGWRDLGLSPFAFLEGSWPRYWTGFDLAVNVLAYLPLGLLLTRAWRRRMPAALAALLAVAAGALLSFGLESAQNWLPARVPSNVDLACNTLGALCGALLALAFGESIGRRSALLRNLLADAAHAELGVVLLGVWLLTQVSPETQLFGSGDLRQLLELKPAVPYAADSFFLIEAAITACNLLAIGLFARALITQHVPTGAVLFCFILLALTVRTLGAALLALPQDALAWLTPGAGLGLAVGGVLLALALLLPATLRTALAALALMAGAAMVNMAPANPYSAAALATWQQGHFFNFNGLTRIAASLWPYVALPYLILSARPRR
ncbi:VanZ family protein [Rhodocyclus purpureus]|uniref:VanZ family protein n=1 Tax=Rhodocyclus purpureus TaxID=1067 RepID=UPI001913CCE9|nr:VanZ family protein [Rhodocyclus purpureus]MBK5914061.1 teicoplanin resistance protein VanZ [Rhodocyclus purpureus]